MRQLAQALFIMLLLLLAVAACDQRTDPKIIEGHWVAENFRIQGIKLPIGPNLFISKDSIGLGSSLESIQLRGIEADGNEVTLKTEFGFDVVFSFEKKDRMYFTVPFIGDRIYYQRADDTITATPSPATTRMVTAQSLFEPPTTAKAEATPKSSGLPATVAASAAPSRQDALEPKREHPNKGPNMQQEPASETHYQQALASLQQGNEDASLRSLSAALANGFSDWQRIEQGPIFDRLQDDMRFQVLRTRWEKE